MKKTKKEFTPYNDYVDRPFDLKWPTAFPLGGPERLRGICIDKK
ncbi:TPA: hypothetical protein ACN1MO_002787 [Enterococcus faecalis]